ncbi:hypothetical protein [Yoonia algicola]|uniref:Hemolytic protein HlpA-like protein n=1 Tax=Yoonia algicola TaxID=3137368 RepID=A0AAN0MHS1_9RHOB
MNQEFDPSVPLHTPVLFLVFNRPDTTSLVFDAIRQARPQRLYVAADAARDGKEGEAERVALVREIVMAVDWPCEVKTLFREKNLGCKYAVSGAISWFFEQEPAGIILEDDCLPSQSFFWFCQEMLDRYQDDDEIMAVTGTNITSRIKFDGSYFFSNYALMWGWASWARAWKKYDLELESWPSDDDGKLLRELRPGNYAFQVTWKRLLQRTYEGEIDTWDYQWIYSCWRHRGLTIAPTVNLVRNLGFSDDATHTFGFDPIRSNLALNELNWPIVHPNERYVHADADRFIGRYWFSETWASIIKTSLLKFWLISKLNDTRKWLMRWR